MDSGEGAVEREEWREEKMEVMERVGRGWRGGKEGETSAGNND